MVFFLFTESTSHIPFITCLNNATMSDKVFEQSRQIEMYLAVPFIFNVIDIFTYTPPLALSCTLSPFLLTSLYLFPLYGDGGGAGGGAAAHKHMHTSN